MNRKNILYILLLSLLLLCACSNNSRNTNALSEEDAKSIAIEHAGLLTDQITFTKSTLDKNDYQPHYDIEFYTNDNKEYEYEIALDTGKILEWNVENMND